SAAGAQGCSGSGSAVGGPRPQGRDVGPEGPPLAALVGGQAQERPRVADAEEVGVALPLAQGRRGVGAVAPVAVDDPAAPGVKLGAQPGASLPAQRGALTLGERGVLAPARGGEGGAAGGVVAISGLQVVGQRRVAPEGGGEEGDRGMVALPELAAEGAQ